MKLSLEQLTKLDEIRQKAKVEGKVSRADLKDIYGELINTPKGCIAILYSIYRSGTDYRADGVFLRVDEIYHKTIEKIKKSKEYIRHPKRFEKEERVYEQLMNRLSEIDRKVRVEARTLSSKDPQEYKLESLEPTDEKLEKIEKEGTDGRDLNVGDLLDELSDEEERNR